MIEVLEWRTDVFKAKAGEQRIALRDAPRRVFNLSHTLTDYQVAGARAVIREDQGVNLLRVPDWGQSQRIGAVSAGSSVYITADLTNVDMGDIGLLWQSDTLFEEVTVNEDSTGVFLSTVNNDYTDARLLPVWDCVGPEGLNIQRIGKQINQCSIALTTTENNDLSATTYAQYRGHDVIPDCPLIGGGLDESIVWQTSEFDNQQILPYHLRQRNYVDYTFSMSWRYFTPADIYALRQWLHSRKGRQKAFWLSSYAHDFEPAADISGTSLTVFALPGAETIGHSETFDIEIVSTAGVSTYRRVSSATGSTPVDGRNTFLLTLDASFSLSLANIKRISFMRCARFDADRIELSHSAGAGVAVRVPCLEIPVP
jgi:hypothetical protein